MDNTDTPQEVADTILTAVGLPDGEIVVTKGDARDEKVVYDYDNDGQFIGWHKELV